MLACCLDCSAVVLITGSPLAARVGQNYDLTCNTFQWETGCTEDVYYLFRGDEFISNNKTLTFNASFNTVSDFPKHYYSCTVTLNGFNFTSNPTRIPAYVQCE